MRGVPTASRSPSSSASTKRAAGHRCGSSSAAQRKPHTEPRTEPFAEALRFADLTHRRRLRGILASAASPGIHRRIELITRYRGLVHLPVRTGQDPPRHGHVHNLRSVTRCTPSTTSAPVTRGSASRWRRRRRSRRSGPPRWRRPIAPEGLRPRIPMRLEHRDQTTWLPGARHRERDGKLRRDVGVVVVESAPRTLPRCSKRRRMPANADSERVAAAGDTPTRPATATAAAASSRLCAPSTESANGTVTPSVVRVPWAPPGPAIPRRDGRRHPADPIADRVDPGEPECLAGAGVVDARDHSLRARAENPPRTPIGARPRPPDRSRRDRPRRWSRRRSRGR